MDGYQKMYILTLINKINTLKYNIIFYNFKFKYRY